MSRVRLRECAQAPSASRRLLIERNREQSSPAHPPATARPPTTAHVFSEQPRDFTCLLARPNSRDGLPLVVHHRLEDALHVVWLCTIAAVWSTTPPSTPTAAAPSSAP